MSAPRWLAHPWRKGREGGVEERLGWLAHPWRWGSWGGGHRRPPLRKAAWLLLASVVVAGVLLLFVIPGRTLIAQGRDISSTQARIAALQRENTALQRQLANLSDPSQIEQEATARFGLVMAGQTAYAIVPAKHQAQAAKQAANAAHKAVSRRVVPVPHG